MATPILGDVDIRELRGVCEAFRAAVRSKMPISRFRLDVLGPGGGRHSVLLEERQRPGIGRSGPCRPAVMTIPVRDARGLIASVTIEDDSRPFLPASGRDEIERVATIYAPMVRACLHAGGSWPKQNASPDGPTGAPR